MSDLEQYLQSDNFLDSNRPRVREKALELTEGLTTDKEKVKALFYYVRDEIKYFPWAYIPQCQSNLKASVTLRRKYGFCMSKAALLAALARTIGLPARIHSVDIINHKLPKKFVEMMGTSVFHYHAYAEIYVEGKWVKLTTALDKKTCIKGGFLPLCETDGATDALFAEKSPDGSIFVEYVADRGVDTTVPIDDIIKLFDEVYMDRFQEFFNTKSKDLKKVQL